VSVFSRPYWGGSGKCQASELMPTFNQMCLHPSSDPFSVLDLSLFGVVPWLAVVLYRDQYGVFLLAYLPAFPVP